MSWTLTIHGGAGRIERARTKPETDAAVRAALGAALDAGGAVLAGSGAALDAVDVLDAGGFDTILVETVGVGQDEVEIAKASHTTVVVSAPGLGDEIQAIKAGIMEIGDVFVINKADREDNLSDGREKVVAILKKRHAPKIPQKVWQEAAESAGYPGPDEMLAAVGAGAASASIPGVPGRTASRAM